MNFDTPKGQDLKPGSQLDVFSLQDILAKIDLEYPNAKLNINLIEGDQVNGYTFKGKALMEAAKEMDSLYSENDNSEIFHNPKTLD